MEDQTVKVKQSETERYFKDIGMAQSQSRAFLVQLRNKLSPIIVDGVKEGKVEGSPVQSEKTLLLRELQSILDEAILLREELIQLHDSVVL